MHRAAALSIVAASIFFAVFAGSMQVMADPVPALVASPSTSPSPDAVDFGADVRERYEHYFNKQWNPSEGSDGYLLQRYLLHVDGHVSRLAGRVEFEHSTASGARAPLDPTWRDDFATTNAYLEYTLGSLSGVAAPSYTIRVGRQELAYGLGRLLDNRSGLNVLQVFDGVRVRTQEGPLRLDIFVVHPVTVAPGSFDDLANRGNALWGAYATHQYANDTLDVYYLGDERGAQFAYSGTEPEVRHTIGSRYATRIGAFDSDTEGDYQFGARAGGTITAWSLATTFGWTWRSSRNALRVGIDAGIGTGDHDTTGSTQTAFRAPYPTGFTFGLIQANGPTNVSGFALTQLYKLGRRFTLSSKEFFYYRQSIEDGLYSPPGFPLRGPIGNAIPIGTAGYAAATEAVSARAVVSVSYARYFTGAFLQQSTPTLGTPSASTAYFSTEIDYHI